MKLGCDDMICFIVCIFNIGYGVKDGRMVTMVDELERLSRARYEPYDTCVISKGRSQYGRYLTSSPSKDTAETAYL